MMKATEYIKIDWTSWRTCVPKEETGHNKKFAAKRIPERKDHLRGFTVLIGRDLVLKIPPQFLPSHKEAASQHLPH